MLSPTYRHPSPASQALYSPPKTEASRIANNYYFQRDSRRAYPQTIVHTQQDLATLLAPPQPLKITEGAENTAEITMTSASQNTMLSETTIPPSLVQVLATRETPLYDLSRLPPVAPGRTYTWKPSEDFQKVDESVYFPMKTFT